MKCTNQPFPLHLCTRDIAARNCVVTHDLTVKIAGEQVAYNLVSAWCSNSICSCTCPTDVYGVARVLRMCMQLHMSYGCVWSCTCPTDSDIRYILKPLSEIHNCSISLYSTLNNNMPQCTL